MGAATYNLADLFEQAVDTWPDRLCVADENRRWTFAELDERANRLAHHFQSKGIGPGDHVGIYAKNRVEWIEAMWAAFKIRAIWININYRYVEAELEYLFANARLKYLVVEPDYVERARGVDSDLPQLVMGTDYEAALAVESPDRDFAPRSNDDLYILFTGGTTGMPKGVIWRHEDVVMTLGGGIDIRTGEKVRAPTDFVEKGSSSPPLVAYPTPPLMHGAAQWMVMGQGIVGRSMVLRRTFDAHAVWETIAAEGVNMMLVTGDAMARPLIDARRDTAADLDVSSLFAMSSSAATFSQVNKDALFDLLPNIIISDSVGSSESGGTGMTVAQKGQAMKGGPTVNPLEGVAVVDDQLQPVAPGQMGQMVRTGHLPIGYMNDDAKTAATFVTLPTGERCVLTGDQAILEPDGTVTLVGRGSVSINSGGEKIFPEEVESAVRSHPSVYDAVVVGVPDDRWGQRVTAVVQARPGETLDLAAVQAECRKHVAGYKIPRQLTLVDEMVRSPAGKADYPWATDIATSDTNAEVQLQ